MNNLEKYFHGGDFENLVLSKVSYIGKQEKVSNILKWMKFKKTFLVLTTMISSLVLVSCNDSDVILPESNLSLSINGLEDLGADFVYEGWIMVNGSPLTSGRFTVNSAGELSQSNFPIPTETLIAATAFILTIEPAVGDDPAPSDVHILAGDFAGSSGTMKVEDPRAIGNNFSTAAGKYILATPTNNDMNDEYSGVWFLDNSSGSPTAGLTLPSLPNGWIYEGWVVINGVPVSTGTFSSVTGSDNFSGFSGPNPGPQYPGEDFLMNAPAGLSFPTDIRGGAVVISIEPVPDNSPDPFLLKPLVHNPTPDAAIHTVLTMNQNLNSIPTGTFKRK
jgi:hypothetical protein